MRARVYWIYNVSCSIKAEGFVWRCFVKKTFYFGLRRVTQKQIVDAIFLRDKIAAVDALLNDIKEELKPEIFTRS